MPSNMGKTWNSSAWINSKDASGTPTMWRLRFEINGEYLGWHSKNLHLKNCKSSGTQPYVMPPIWSWKTALWPTMPTWHSNIHLQATINSPVPAKESQSGSITANSYGIIILDENITAPATARFLPGTANLYVKYEIPFRWYYFRREAIPQMGLR